MVPADSRRIPRAPRYSGYHYASSDFVYRTITVYGGTFQTLPLARYLAISWSYNPMDAVTSMVWANPRSLATTWGIIIYFLFLQVLRCFSSLRLPTALQYNRPSTGWVVPFGNPRIKGYLHLPAAYRSLSRPSSPPRAKASAMRPSLLSLSIRSHLRAGGMIYTFSSLLLKLLFACTICHRSFIFVSYVSDGVENNLSLIHI